MIPKLTPKSDCINARSACSYVCVCGRESHRGTPAPSKAVETVWISSALLKDAEMQTVGGGDQSPERTGWPSSALPVVVLLSLAVIRRQIEDIYCWRY